MGAMMSTKQKCQNFQYFQKKSKCFMFSQSFSKNSNLSKNQKFQKFQKISKKRLLAIVFSYVGLTFESSDATNICKTDVVGQGDTTLHFRDLDGSLSGTAGATVINNDVSIIGDNCLYNSISNLATCPPEQTFAAVCKIVYLSIYMNTSI
jgi:hypothetical protein